MNLNPILCALDTTDVAMATTLAAKAGDSVGGIKLGLEFFGSNGLKGVRQVAKAADAPLFLDLKFHDIPNTVAGAVRAVMPAKPALLNVHASGGGAMMRAASDAATEAADREGCDRPIMLAVTILTSLANEDLSAIGYAHKAVDQVRRLAGLAQSSGMDGVVCSAHEVALLRADCGPDFKLVVPGIRPHWAATNDQKRVMSPAEAMAAGADWLVIGRPITAADDPASAARRILAELG